MRSSRTGLTVRAAAMVAVATVIALAGSLVGNQGGWVPLDRSSTPDQTGLAFVDVTSDVGIDFRHGAFRWGLSPDPVAMMGGGICWVDANGDGWLDLFVVNSYAEAEWPSWQDAGGLPTSRLYRNDGTEFRDVTEEANAGLAIRGLGCVAGDVDSDGDEDLYVTGATSNALLLNDGDGRFDDVAAVAGVDAYGWQSSAALGDLDGDGLVDLFVAGYVNLIRPVESSTEGFPRTYEALPDLMYRNVGVGEDGVPRFIEVGATAGVEPDGPSYGLGSVMSDIDLDGDLDIYVANDTDPNQLYLNESAPGELRFREVAKRSGVDDAFSGMGVASGDLDGNGAPDLAVTNLDHQLHGVFGNSGAGLFASVAASSGISSLEGEYTGWGVIPADFDADTDIDLFVVNGNVPVMYPEADRQPLQLFENQAASDGGLAFESGARTGGLGGVAIIGRGAAAADYDNDGDLDVAVSQVGGPLVLFSNVGGAGNTLTIEFGRFSPGAIAIVVLPDGTSLSRQVLAGSSYLSSEDPRLHFGIGSHEIVADLEVRLPDGTVERFTDVRANGVVRIP